MRLDTSRLFDKYLVQLIYGYNNISFMCRAMHVDGLYKFSVINL